MVEKMAGKIRKKNGPFFKLFTARKGGYGVTF